MNLKSLVNRNDKRGKNGSAKGSAGADKENFRTSMFIMGFLVVPLVLVIIAATIARLKHMGKLRKLKLVGLGAQLDSKQKELGKWMSRTANSKNRNGFTRLRQDSEDEEAEALTKPTASTSSAGGNLDNSDCESNSEQEISLPKVSNA
jgi:hypothetical protein